MATTISENPDPVSGKAGRLPAQQRESRRREVLAAALEELAVSGYDGMTMSKVAARARASKETLYSWFGDKRGLVAALIEENSAEAHERISQLMASASTDRDAARRALTDFAAGLLVLLTGEASIAVNRAAVASPELAATLHEHGRQRTGALASQYLARLNEAGVIDVDDPEEAFRLFFGLVVQDRQIEALLTGASLSEPRARQYARAGVEAFFSLRAVG